MADGVPPVDELPPLARFEIYRVLVERLHLVDGDVLVDLGCGEGGILVEAAERLQEVSLVGVDRDAESLAVASAWLRRLAARHHLVEADLSEPLSLPGPPATKLVCHNVLECLADPLAVLVNAHALMAPGAVSIWSHIDFDSAVINGADPALTRRIVHAYADLTEAGMDCSDGQMGRKLAALVARSPLERVAVDSHVSSSTQLAGGARMRVNRMMAALYDASYDGSVAITPEELDGWVNELLAAEGRGEFFYAHTSFMVTAVKPGEPDGQPSGGAEAPSK